MALADEKDGSVVSTPTWVVALDDGKVGFSTWYNRPSQRQREGAPVSTFVVTYTHPDEVGWQAHVGPHVDWLVRHVDAGVLRASGPFVGTSVRSAMLVIDAADRVALDQLIATDPFAVEGLIAEMTVTEWDPLFGELAKRPRS